MLAQIDGSVRHRPPSRRVGRSLAGLRSSRLAPAKAPTDQPRDVSLAKCRRRTSHILEPGWIAGCAGRTSSLVGPSRRPSNGSTCGDCRPGRSRRRAARCGRSAARDHLQLKPTCVLLYSRLQGLKDREIAMKELRFGLVCYGGISLAVYMHGITSELHQLGAGIEGQRQRPREQVSREHHRARLFRDAWPDCCQAAGGRDRRRDRRHVGRRHQRRCARQGARPRPRPGAPQAGLVQQGQHP